MFDLYFILGEDKDVRLLVQSAKNEYFIITEALYELWYDEELEISGVCQIDEHYIITRLKPLLKSSLYTLIITYTIAGEIFKKKIRIEVS